MIMRQAPFDSTSELNIIPKTLSVRDQCYACMKVLFINRKPGGRYVCKLTFECTDCCCLVWNVYQNMSIKLPTKTINVQILHVLLLSMMIVVGCALMAVYFVIWLYCDGNVRHNLHLLGRQSFNGLTCF